LSAPRITQAGHPVLRKRAADVPEDMFGGRELATLVDLMVDVMRAAPGVGLAAPQIGVGLRVLVMEDAPELMARLTDAQRAERGREPLPLTVIVNPALTLLGHATATFFEGCLSVVGYMALVERRLEVELRGRDPKGAPVSMRLRGWPARIAQHEVDHLDGTLYVDRMCPRTLCANAEVQARWLDTPIPQILEALGSG
jgi:peptide deformylase